MCSVNFPTAREQFFCNCGAEQQKNLSKHKNRLDGECHYTAIKKKNHAIEV